MTKASNQINPFARLEQLLGKGTVDRFKNARVAVFGLGAVGSFVVEGLRAFRHRISEACGF